MKRTILCLVTLISLQTGFTQQGKTPIVATDMLKIKTPASISINKEGNRAVFSLTTIEADGDSKWEFKYVNQLWLINTDGSGAPRQITTKENSSQPTWSPDGKQILFVRVVDTKPQLFILPLDGGEARQLTRFKYGASSPKWSSDGKQILFSASIPFKDLLKDSILNPGTSGPVWPMERPGLSNTQATNLTKSKANPDGSIDEVRSYLDNNATDKKARVITKLSFQDETDVNPDISFSHYFIMDASGTGVPLALTKGFYRFGAASFTPDSRQIIMSGSIDSIQHPDRALESSIFIVNNDGTGFRVLLSEKGKNYSSPVISNNGKWLGFQYGPISFVSVPALAITPLATPGKPVTDIPFDRNKSNLTWSDDDRYLFFTTSSNGGVPMYRADIQSRKVEQLTDYNSGVNNFDLHGNTILFVKTEVANPAEIWSMDGAGKNAKRISDFNTGWLKEKQLSFPEKKTFVNEKGETIEYWIMKPANYVVGKKYPLLLEIHGGPSSMWGPGELSMWHEYQFFCSKGYGIVYSNPRGSGGYGLDFLRSNVKDWGKGPTSDVLTALDKTVAEGWADTSKLLITGGSYAGYLVAWIIAHDNRFKAACAQRGVYDLATFFGEGNAWRLVPNYFGGYPWEKQVKQLLDSESPINYVESIHTPFIIFHGENDRRTGIIQSEMLFRNLKALGREVEYVRHPAATHELTRSGNNRQRIDQMLRTWEFFERYIQVQ